MSRHTFTNVLLCLTAICGLAATQAHAQYYGGVVLNGAQSRSEFGFNGGERPSEIVALNQLSQGLTLSTEPSLGMKLGYRVSRYFSVEGQYADRAATTAPSVFSTDATNVRERRMGLDLVGSVAVFKNLSLAGRAGFRSETTLNLTDPVNGVTRSVNAGAVGVGVQYNFNSSLGLRFEVEKSRRFFSDRHQDADNVSFGVQWRF